MAHNEYYRKYDPEQIAVVTEKKHSRSLPGLLLVPLFLLVGLGALLLVRQESKVNEENQTVDDSTRFGIGGAPPLTSKPTLSPTPTPSFEYVPQTPDAEDAY